MSQTYEYLVVLEPELASVAFVEAQEMSRLRHPMTGRVSETTVTKRRPSPCFIRIVAGAPRLRLTDSHFHNLGAMKSLVARMDTLREFVGESWAAVPVDEPETFVNDDEHVSEWYRQAAPSPAAELWYMEFHRGPLEGPE
ncbi:MAG: hypothetical protein AAGF12_00425 [Myxococcota bacterium]